MPFADGAEAGARSPFEVRVGLTVPRFRGTVRQSDAGALSDDQFWLLQNVRIDGTGVKNRPGLAQIAQNAMDACVYGLWDDRNPDYDGNAIFTASRGFGYSPQSWSPDTVETLFEDPPWSECNIGVKFNGQTFILDDLGTAYLLTYTVTDGVPTFSAVAAWTLTTTLTNWRPHAFTEFDGALWFTIAEGGGGKVELWQWTGGAAASLVRSVTPVSGDTESILGTDGTDLYMGTVGLIEKYNNGAWTDLTMPGGLSFWHPVGYYGLARPPYLYFSGYDAAEPQATRVLTILKVLDETVTVANNAIPTYSGANNNYGLVTALNGELYVVGNTSQGVDNFSLYQLSGADAATAIADLTDQVGAAASNDDGILLQMYQWRGQLFMSVPLGVVSAGFIRASLSNVAVWTLVCADINIDADGRSTPGGNLFTA